MKLPAKALAAVRQAGTVDRAGAVLLASALLYALFGFPWLERVECLRSGPRELIWATICADGGIGTAYIRIPWRLVAIWRQMRARPATWLLVAVGAFVLACGGTHIVSIIMMFSPYYYMAMKLKAITAVISLAVARIIDHEEQRLLALGRQNEELAKERDEAKAARERADEQTKLAEARAIEVEAARVKDAEQAAEIQRQADEAKRQAENALNARAELAQTNQALAEINAQLDAARAVESARAREQATRAQTAEAENVTLERMIAELRAKDVRIEAQGEALRTLHTPILQALDSVLVTVLVGALDSMQVGSWRERLLERVSASRSRLTIFDLTALQIVDSKAAEAIIKTARAVGLLGSQCVLTGMQPYVAQTIVEQGIDLQEFRALPTLREALAMAMRKA